MVIKSIIIIIACYLLGGCWDKTIQPSDVQSNETEINGELNSKEAAKSSFEQDIRVNRLIDAAPPSANVELIRDLENEDRLSTKLRLRPGDYDDFTPLLEFKSLEYLKIDNFQLTDITNITVLTELENLRTLILWAPKVTDIKPVSAFINLTELNIDVDNRCTDASELLPLIKLEKLAFHPSSPEAIMNIVKLTGLKELYLSLESEGMDISPLQKLTNLTCLSIESGDDSQRSELDLAGLEKLHKLEHLELEGFIVKNINALINLPCLSSVDLRFNDVSDEDIDLLRANKVIYIDLYKDH
jgi:hypothetical protein